MKENVTILIYTFPQPGAEETAFAKIVASIERTWGHVGLLKTVIVASHRFAAVEEFVAAHDNVELQVEPSIVYGDVKTMSLDCITKLHSRFSTRYVLIVQDDGFPIRGGLEEFVGKWDYIGAPIMCDGWKRRLCFALDLASYNGGFSLRSKRYCEYVSKWWFRFGHLWLSPRSRHIGEDFVYCFLARLNPYAWLKFRFPSEREAFCFSVDVLNGAVSYPSGIIPFGLHGKYTLKTCGARPFLDLAEKSPEEMTSAERRMLVSAIERTKDILLKEPVEGEVAELVCGFWNNDPKCVRRVVDWGKTLVPEVVRNRYIGDIGTYRNSIRSILYHTRFRGPLKVLVLTCLEEILRNAVLYNRGEDKGETFYNLAHRLSFAPADGTDVKTFVARLIVKETPDGKRTWTVEFSNKKELTEVPTTGEAATVKATRLNPPSTHTILKKLYAVNGLSCNTIIPENFGINYPEVYQVPENIGQ